LPAFRLAGRSGGAFVAVVAPRTTPAEIIKKLNKAINGALVEPAKKARLADMGVTEPSGPAAEFGKLVAEEPEKWAKVVKSSGAKAQRSE
jgi:tripartite-type tricarboxylate transporter receptor subunit TctC